MEKEGRLRKQKAGIIQIEALLKQAGRALLLLKGYAPTGPAQHKTVVEVTSFILGAKYQNLTDQFESMRRKRNEMTYEAGALLSMSESQQSFVDAKALVRQILLEAKSKDPQFRLKFELKSSDAK